MSKALLKGDFVDYRLEIFASFAEEISGLPSVFLNVTVMWSWFTMG
ncbi:MAG: hypothetical protein JO025_16905 [Verrucomicrobia bacterium]|nr:hypothetical protein [Verrucomicrobiota bacterium]